MSARRRGRDLPAWRAPFSLTAVPAIAAALLAALALAGCGQMGPLVLPGSESGQGETGTDSAAGNPTAAGSGDEDEDSDESGDGNEQ